MNQGIIKIMKRKLPKESQDHEAVILDIANTIVEKGNNQIAFVILFGSFARGDWVFDMYKEGTTTYCYASDYDFLVVVKKGNKSGSHYTTRIELELEKALAKRVRYIGQHFPSITVEPIRRVNKFLERGHFFFSDIKKEGILLYDSGEFELSDAKKLTKAEIVDIAQEHYDQWFEPAVNFLSDAKIIKSNGSLKNSAFLLHQATESLLNCALLVLTDYKGKIHNIEKLLKQCSSQDGTFLKIFPLGTEDEKQCFKLLKDAYIDARYNKDYKITEEQLDYLIEKIENLEIIVDDKCKKHIKSLG